MKPAGAPKAQRLLAVVAHPDDESFGLGALLAEASAAGWRTGVLCATHGEASTLHGVGGDLHAVRELELRRAAEHLGVGWVRLLRHPDGALADHAEALLDDVAAAASAFGPDLLLTFDPSGITGHPDHVAATRAAVAVGRDQGIPVIAWGLPQDVVLDLADEGMTGFRALPDDVPTLTVGVDRTAQRRAIGEHPSQAVPSSPLWRRLELLGDVEHLRWLHSTLAAPVPFRVLTVSGLRRRLPQPLP